MSIIQFYIPSNKYYRPFGTQLRRVCFTLFNPTTSSTVLYPLPDLLEYLFLLLSSLNLLYSIFFTFVQMYSVVQQYDPDSNDEKAVPIPVQRVHRLRKRIAACFAVSLLASLSFNIYWLIPKFPLPQPVECAASKYGTQLSVFHSSVRN